MSGTEFEALIAKLFERDGYTVTRRGGSGDEGIDLILTIAQSTDVVQCKRWRGDIGAPVIRDFYGAMMHAGARHGFVITTAAFSAAARDFARGKPISLVDGTRLLAWITGAPASGGQPGPKAGEQRRRSSEDGTDKDSAQGSSESPRAGMGFDPYAVLGIRHGASPDEVRAAWVLLMQQYHPDKVAHLGPELQQLALAKSKEINRAYHQLSGR